MPDIILIGPTRSLKSPDAIPATAHDVKYLLDPGQYNVTLRRINWNNVTLQAAEELKRPVLITDQNKEFGLFQLINGSATFKNLIAWFPGNRGVFAQTKNKANLTVERLTINQGCLFWGLGGGRVQYNNSFSAGKPWKYLFCNFNNDIEYMGLDQSGTPDVANQLHGGVYECPIRIMNAGSAYFKKVRVQYGLDSRGKPLKNGEVFQLRSGWSKGKSKFCLDDCEGYNAAFGWMKDPEIPEPELPIESITVMGGKLNHIDRCGKLKSIVLSKVLIGNPPVLTSKTY